MILSMKEKNSNSDSNNNNNDLLIKMNISEKIDI